MTKAYPPLSPETVEKYGKPIPKQTPPPPFPSAAVGKADKGWIKVLIFVKEDGTVAAATVVKAEPRGLFENATIQAVFKWTFEPYPVPWGAVQQVDFKLK